MPKGVYIRTKPPWNKGLHIYCGGKRFVKGQVAPMKGRKRPDITGEKNPRWKGEILHNGYIRINKPNHPFAECKGYVMKHRFIVEQYIGRFLNPGEIVHHINKNTTDNRIKNLIVFKNSACHFWFHKKGVYKDDHIVFDGSKTLTN